MRPFWGGGWLDAQAYLHASLLSGSRYFRLCSRFLALIPKVSLVVCFGSQLGDLKLLYLLLLLLAACSDCMSPDTDQVKEASARWAPGASP